MAAPGSCVGPARDRLGPGRAPPPRRPLPAPASRRVSAQRTLSRPIPPAVRPADGIGSCRRSFRHLSAWRTVATSISSNVRVADHRREGHTTGRRPEHAPRSRGVHRTGSPAAADQIRSAPRTSDRNRRPARPAPGAGSRPAAEPVGAGCTHATLERLGRRGRRHPRRRRTATLSRADSRPRDRPARRDARRGGGRRFPIPPGSRRRPPRHRSRAPRPPRSRPVLPGPDRAPLRPARRGPGRGLPPGCQR